MSDSRQQLKEIIRECIVENINEFDFQGLQRKFGKFIGHPGLAKGKGGYGAKVDKMFNTQAHKTRGANLDKANANKNIQIVARVSQTLNNVIRGAAKDNPTSVANFTKEFLQLVKKYGLDKSSVQPSEGI